MYKHHLTLTRPQEAIIAESQPAARAGHSRQGFPPSDSSERVPGVLGPESGGDPASCIFKQTLAVQGTRMHCPQKEMCSPDPLCRGYILFTDPKAEHVR